MEIILLYCTVRERLVYTLHCYKQNNKLIIVYVTLLDCKLLQKMNRLKYLVSD